MWYYFSRRTFMIFFWYLFHLWVISRASGSEPARREPCINIVIVKAVFLEPKKLISNCLQELSFFINNINNTLSEPSSQQLFHLCGMFRASVRGPNRHKPCAVAVNCIFRCSTVYRNSLFFLNNK